MQMIKLHSEFQIDKQQNESTGKYQDQMASILARLNRDSQAIDEDSSMDQIPTQLRLSWKDNR